MSDQLHLFGVIDPPEFGDCFTSCAHFGGPNDDYFPGTHTRRCMYGISQCGTSGADMYQRTVNNRVHVYCRFYEPK